MCLSCTHLTKGTSLKEADSVYFYSREEEGRRGWENGLKRMILYLVVNRKGWVSTVYSHVLCLCIGVVAGFVQFIALSKATKL